jgi:hypothetical protein
VEGDSLEPSDDTDLSKHYLLITTVDPDGYASKGLGLLPGDKVYGMSVLAKDRLTITKETRMSNRDIITHIQDSVSAATADKFAKNKKAAETKKAKQLKVIKWHETFDEAKLQSDMNSHNIIYVMICFTDRRCNRPVAAVAAEKAEKKDQGAAGNGGQPVPISFMEALRKTDGSERTSPAPATEHGPRGSRGSIAAFKSFASANRDWLHTVPISLFECAK